MPPPPHRRSESRTVFAAAWGRRQHAVRIIIHNIPYIFAINHRSRLSLESSRAPPIDQKRRKTWRVVIVVVVVAAYHSIMVGTMWAESSKNVGWRLLLPFWRILFLLHFEKSNPCELFWPQHGVGKFVFILPKPITYKIVQGLIPSITYSWGRRQLK